MTKRDSFLLRLSPEMMDALRQWSQDEFRSMNSQIEMILARALEKAGRKTKGESNDKEGCSPKKEER